jgi:hypothetical protein
VFRVHVKGSAEMVQKNGTTFHVGSLYELRFRMGNKPEEIVYSAFFHNKDHFHTGAKEAIDDMWESSRSGNSKELRFHKVPLNLDIFNGYLVLPEIMPEWLQKKVQLF